MAMRLLIGNTTGTLIGELEVNVGPISWRLNQIGRLQFTIERGNAKATSDMLRYGNRVCAQFDNGLPDWGGVIDTPRDWSYGIIQANVYSAEYVLGWRTTDRGRYFTSASVGYILRKLIEEAQAEENLGISIGEIWYGGEVHSPDYHLDNVLKIVQDSVCDRLSTAEFEIVPSVSNGQIIFTANLYERLGEDKSASVALIEDTNLVSAAMTEVGPIVNYWQLAGNGQNWGADRLTSMAEDRASISTYGLRMDAKVFGDVSIQETLDAHASALLDESNDARLVFDLDAANVAPALFADYRVGDNVWLELPSYGFSGVGQSVRVIGREFNPVTGFCRLVVEG